MNYGLPFQGSKNRIAKRIVELLPSAETLYDLFAGGCAITHAALLSGKWKRVVCNDITDIPRLFVDAVNGKYADEERWISRETFEKFKNTDPYIRLIWSFGGNQKDYIYSREIEPYKRLMHEVCFAGTPYARKLMLIPLVRYLLKVSPAGRTDSQNPEGLERLQSIERYVHLENLERLQNVKNASALGARNLVQLQSDYRDVEISQSDSVIYCDIPYAGTKGYLTKFDHDVFYRWALSQTVPVFISEYWMPDDFECVAEFERKSTFSSTSNNLLKVERIYRPKKQLFEERAIKKANHEL